MAALDDAQVQQFWDQGYLVVEDLIDVDRYLEPMRADYGERLDELMRGLHERGELASDYADLPFGARMTQLYRETGQHWARHFDFSLPLRNDIKPDEPCFFPPSVFAMLRNPDVLDVVESFIGPELYSNPVQHVRIKPPESVLPDSTNTLSNVTPWHQDASVVIEEADRTEMITVWVPVTDATVDNGCLIVVPKNHESGLFEHCPAVPGVSFKYLSTKFFDAERAVPVPMKRGSALFMTRMTPHSSLPNNSDEIRWSMDLRYNPTGQPTGRPEFPGFVARSKADPASELRDPELWRQRWLETRERMATAPASITFTRNWTGEGCA